MLFEEVQVLKESEYDEKNRLKTYVEIANDIGKVLKSDVEFKGRSVIVGKLSSGENMQEWAETMEGLEECLSQMEEINYFKDIEGGYSYFKIRESNWRAKKPSWFQRNFMKSGDIGLKSDNVPIEYKKELETLPEEYKVLFE